MSAPASQAPVPVWLGVDWAGEYLRELDRAIRFLRARGILCSKVDRESQIARFRVTGRQNALYGHDVIEMAEGLGFAG